MEYKILYTTWYGGQRKIAVFHFKQGMIIEFTLDELNKNELNEHIIQFIRENRTMIESGFWDYNP